MKKRLGPSDILFPVPAALVATGSPDKPNVLAVAWIGMMASNPPILAVSLHKTRHSLLIVQKTKEFTVNIPQASQFREVDYCGLVSGRIRNKVLDCHLTLNPAAVVKPPIIEECPFNLECRVVSQTVLGAWVVFFAEVVETHVDADKVNSKGKLDISRIDPLVYCATVREYWNLGKRLGLGFNAGKEIMKILKPA